MKKSLLGLAFFLLLSACDDSQKVNLFEEFQSRPTVELSLEDGTSIPGFEGNYCTDVLCMEKPDPNWAAFTHAPVANGETLLILIENTSSKVESVSVELIKQNGDRFNRDHPVVQRSDTIFAVEEPFNTTENLVTLHVRVNLAGGGRSNFYFPLDLRNL